MIRSSGISILVRRSTGGTGHGHGQCEHTIARDITLRIASNVVSHSLSPYTDLANVSLGSDHSTGVIRGVLRFFNS